MIAAVIGKNFGDEGKGLATDHFCAQVPFCCVVKHNGGAQAGHTVVHHGRRAVFHQLSSGSFRGASTYFASTYYPDFFKLREEIEDFGKNPGIYCSINTPLIYIDDVLINQALEAARGSARHGSCGMGINEGDIRTAAGFGLYARDVFGTDAVTLAGKMAEIREEYGMKRMLEAGLDKGDSEYMEMLSDKNVLINAAEEMLHASECVTPVSDEPEFLHSQENIVFESGQGLLLDSENELYAPHVTASRTGLHNVMLLLKTAGLKLDEACYVTRTYVTRHGAGSLPCECARDALGRLGTDLTNIVNDWQGAIRYAAHVSVEDFLAPVTADLREAESLYPGAVRNTSLFITHLNETDSKIVFADRRIDVRKFLSMPEVSGTFGRHYLSYSEGNACHSCEQ